MKKIWLVAATTYRQRIRSGSFLFLTLGLPLLMIIAGAIPFLMSRNGDSLPAVGYVDQTGRLAQLTQVTVEDVTLNLTVYDSTEAAQVAVQQGTITGYLAIPEGYFQDEAATYYGEEEPSAQLEEALAIFVRRAMLADQPEWLWERLANPARLTYVGRDGGIELMEGPGVFIHFAFPAALALVFALVLFTGANQMGPVMVREKDQRAMEMVITSVSARELVVGKVLGMTLLSLTQVGIWLAGAAVAAALALSGSLEPQQIHIPWHAVAWAILLGVPGYFLYAVFASGLGIIAGDSQQAQQLAGILGIVGIAPLWFAGVLLQAPDGPAAIAFTLFPFTAPIFGLLRMALTEVPTWQLATGLALILACLIAGIWTVARIFRAAMLMYGQTLRPRQLLQALREA